MHGTVVYAAPVWANLVKQKYNYVCMQCGESEDLQARHITPPSLGGKNTLENGIALCLRCRSKGLLCTSKVRFNFSVPCDLYENLEAYCSSSGRSFNDVIKQLVADFAYGGSLYLNGFHEDASRNDRRLSVPVLRQVYDSFAVKCREANRVTGTVIKSLIYLYLKPFEGAHHDTGRKEDREVAARVRQ